MNNIEQTIKRILREEISTKSTNKEFNKYKDSKFHSLREYTFQDIVDNWDEVSNHRNPNIKTIKFFVDNPDEITELTYDERGLEDGYHRLIASKILNKPRVKYTTLKENKLNEQVDNPAKIKLNKLIDKQGLLNVIRTIGIEKVSKILQLEPIEIAREHFEDKIYSIHDFDVRTGSYDFGFKITDIIQNDPDDEEWYVYAKIVNGTVDIDGDERELWDSDLWEEDYWWEIQNEIDDILVDILTPFLPKEIYVEIEHNLK